MHACYSLMKRQQLTDFVAGWLRAPPQLHRWFLGDDLVILRAAPVQTPAERRSVWVDPCKPPWWSGRRAPNLMSVRKVTKFCLWRGSVPCVLHKTVCLHQWFPFKGVRTQFSVDRSVATGELWEMWRMFPTRTRLKSDSQTEVFMCFIAHSWVGWNVSTCRVCPTLKPEWLQE